MSTAGTLRDELRSLDADMADKYEAEITEAMWGCPRKNFAALKAITAKYASEAQVLRSLNDPAFEARAARIIAEKRGWDVELPAADETATVRVDLDVVSDEDDADQDA